MMRASVRTVILRFLKLRVMASEDSWSSIGRTRGRTSIRVTAEPNALNTSANSTPTAPAPMIAREGGAASRNRASSVESTVVRSSSSPTWGSPLTRVPVAITTPFAAW